MADSLTTSQGDRIVASTRPADGFGRAGHAAGGEIDHSQLIPEPTTSHDTGLSMATLIDLMAKAMYYRVQATPLDLSDHLRLSMRVIDELIQVMRDDALVEITGQASTFHSSYSLTDRGRELAERAFERNGYVGPAPVTLERYVEIQEQQSIRSAVPTPGDIRSSMEHLVLQESVIESIGAAVMSTHTVLLYGASGNGKSTVAAAVQSMLPGKVGVPYALDVSGHTVRVFDPRVHRIDGEEPRVDAEGTANFFSAPDGVDGRFALCPRPIVTLGSELTLGHLELTFSAAERSYIAPPQVKANGGVLVIDDLGRQLVRPEELLNRWIGPMGMGEDHLVLQTGESIRVPFDVMLVFATNLDPQTLGDEAFERRIRHKVLVHSPDQREFLEIMERECAGLGVPFDGSVAQSFTSELYATEGRVPRAAHPGDLLRNLVDFARFRSEEPRMTLDGMRAAAQAFFPSATADA
jgi:energy-coupling factor transporter ATP-binding protein EcfA2